MGVGGGQKTWGGSELIGSSETCGVSESFGDVKPFQWQCLSPLVAGSQDYITLSRSARPAGAEVKTRIPKSYGMTRGKIKIAKTDEEFLRRGSCKNQRLQRDNGLRRDQ